MISTITLTVDMLKVLTRRMKFGLQMQMMSGHKVMSPVGYVNLSRSKYVTTVGINHYGYLILKTASKYNSIT